MYPEFLSPEWLIIYGGLFLTLIIIFVETALPIGVVIPGGEMLLFITGLLGGTKWIDVSILFIIIPVTLVSFMADLTGYTIGYNYGRKIYERGSRMFYRRKHLKRTDRFIKKFGVMSLVIAKFFPVIRTYSPIVNGAREHNFHKFFVFAGIGSLVYINSLILSGYFIGKIFPDLKSSIEYIVTAVFVLIFLAPIVAIVRRNIKIKAKSSN